MDSTLSHPSTNVSSTGGRGHLHACAAFLMLGGGSLIMMVALGSLSIRQVFLNDNVRALLQQAAGVTMVLAIVLSYPHFIWSFRFAYQQRLKFILKHSWQLIFFPLIMLALLTTSLQAWNCPVEQFPILAAIEQRVSTTGILLHWSNYTGIGQLLLASLLAVYIVTSGHHFSMQAFGVALACGEDKDYRLTPPQKRILVANMYALWAVNLFSGYRFLSFLNNRSFAYRPVEYPGSLSLVAGIAFVLSGLALVFFVIVPKFKELRRLPPLLATVPILSIWLWLQPIFQPYGYQAWVVPLAHGAQYLWLSCRVENNDFSGRLERIEPQWAWAKTAYVFSIGSACVLLGYLAFQYVPVTLDRTLIGTKMGINFYMLAGFIFISVHHYMVDSVVWKHDSQVRKRLGKSTG